MAQILLQSKLSTFQPANTGTPVSPFEVCNWGNIYLYDGLSGTIDIGGNWNDDTGTGVLTGASLQVSALNAGSYQFTYTASNGVCADATTTITVDLNDCTGDRRSCCETISLFIQILQLDYLQLSLKEMFQMLNYLFLI